MKNTELQEKIVSVAKGFVGMKEIPGNMGWTDEVFQKKMVERGWKTRHEWCAYQGELIWFDGMGDLPIDIDNLDKSLENLNTYGEAFDKLFSGGSTKTFKNFKAAGWPVGMVPAVGAIIIWCRVSNGVASWKGHTGVVIGYNDKYIFTVEGNTNGKGSPDGGLTAEKTRGYDYKVRNGLQIYGFIYPPGVVPAVPFQNKSEGDAFREFINDNYPDYARLIDLDRSGAFYNSYIAQAYRDHGHMYKVV